MLTSIKLGNFKAFGPTQTIPIKPITLIFGPNSAGKSSIIHSLLLAHQAAVVDGELDVHYPRLSGSTVDLGGFAGYVHRHQTGSAVNWACEFSADQLRGPLAEILAQGCSKLQLSLQIGAPQRERMARQTRLNPKSGKTETVSMPTGVYELDGKPRVQIMELRLDEQLVMRLSARQPGVMSIDDVNIRHPLLNQRLRSCFTGNSAVPGLEKVTDEELESTARQMLAMMTALVKQFLPTSIGKKGLEALEEHLFRADPDVLFEGVAPNNPRLFRAVKFEFWRLVDGMLATVAITVREKLATLTYLGPLRTIPPRDFGASGAHDPDWYSGGAFAWHVVRENEAVRQKLNRWLADKNKLSVPYELQLRSLLDGAELSEPLSRAVYDFDVRSRSGLFRDFREALASSAMPEAEKSKILDTLLSLHQDIEPSEGTAADSQELDWLAANATASLLPKSELVLFDKRKETPVTHRDVGIGISQVLPVLVAAYGSENQTIAIEQPEIHVHPAVQAELGDVFIEAALKEGGPRNTFILETHSEHLILRILRRVRQTTSGSYMEEALATGDDRLVEEHVPVRPEDICVLYVEAGDGSASVTELPITPEGDFAAGWPNGFFTERGKELF